jgi:hypothetical protein
MVAQDYAAFTASFVPSERVFSKAGGLITKPRNRLAPTTAEQVMCLPYWLGLPEADDKGKKAYSQHEGYEDAFDIEHSAFSGEDAEEDEGFVL